MIGETVIPLLKQFKKPKPVELSAEPLSGILVDSIAYSLAQHGVSLPAEWDWHWIAAQQIDDETYQGTLNRRLSKFVSVARRQYNLYGWRLSAALEDAQNSIGREMFSHEVLLCFTNRLHWRSGAFGDKGSCFWKGMKKHRLRFEANGGWAVRLHKYKSTYGDLPETVDNTRGYGRAWLKPDVPYKGMFVTFNAYGVQHAAIARIINAAIGYQHKPIQVRAGTTNVYINGDAFVHWPKDADAQQCQLPELVTLFD